jgi:hydroxymethylbilane synthase
MVTLMTKTSIRVGSRDSRLAVVQSELTISRLQAAHPELELSLHTMKTTGDKILDKSLDKIGGKGLFIRELDDALLSKRVDFAVHSLKDMPMELEPGIVIRAYSKREDPRDALILPQNQDGLELGSIITPDTSLPIGCSGLRRKLRISEIYPGWAIKDIRGNVQTRLRKLDSGEYGAIILAVAGLKRLGLEDRISRIFEPDEMLPAAGQGVMTVVSRVEDSYPWLASVDDANSRYSSIAERAFVKALDGGCSAPIAAHARVDGDQIKLTGLYSTAEDTQHYVIGNIEGKVHQSEDLGKQLAQELLGKYESKTELYEVCITTEE